MKNSILLFLFLLTLVSCGKGGSGGSSGPVKEVEEQRVYQDLVEATPGIYYAVLRPINFYANGFIPYGAATFTLKDDVLQVDITMDDDQAVTHMQALHVGTRCPTLADDRNGDGFVDYDEAQEVVGPALMPLDDDLNTQKAGFEVYPKGPAMTYKKVASLTKINSDLVKADEDPSDNIMKLNGKSIGFEGRVVLVHGTTMQSTFPSSLSFYKGMPVHLSLPVVCGTLGKVD